MVNAVADWLLTVWASVIVGLNRHNELAARDLSRPFGGIVWHPVTPPTGRLWSAASER
jgi:hypothetical protein